MNIYIYIMYIILYAHRAAANDLISSPVFENENENKYNNIVLSYYYIGSAAARTYVQKQTWPPLATAKTGVGAIVSKPTDA